MTGKRKALSFVLKGVFSAAAVIYLLTSKTSLPEVGQSFAAANMELLAAAFSLHLLGLLISAVRWRILIRAHGDSIPLGPLIKSYLVGIFFNSFMPGRIGGDVVRIWDGSGYSRSAVKSTAIIVIERLTGIVVLFFFSLTASLIRLDMTQTFSLVKAALAIGAAGLLLTGFFFTPAAARLMDLLPARGLAHRVKQKIFAFRSAALHFGSHKTALGKAFFCSLILQINVIFYYYLIGKSLNLSISLLDYFIFIPILHMVLLIPIALNGMGLRELTLKGILSFYGCTTATAVSFAWIDVIFILAVGIIGAVVFIFRRRKPPAPG